MSKPHLVVVEDEPDILEVLSYNLKHAGYAVSTALDGAIGLDLIKKTLPDLVLLDLMLPGMDGLDICRVIRGASHTQHIPIIMLTAKGEESDVVLGLGIGADDYIAKPFSPKELVARVEAVLRRVESGNSPHKNTYCSFDGLTIDSVKHQVFVGYSGVADSEVKFTATEFRLLFFLASHPGQVFSREQLLNSGFGNDAVVIDRNIDVHIRAIRKKLGVQAGFIQTIRGVGYRFK
ncbi:MAG: response regulator transcription factor [Pseudomonadales bacterium]|nr:response regulator transcription factor [Pseudomonadales bacterium]